MAEPSTDDDAFLEEVTRGDVALRTGDAADPRSLLLAKMPPDILEKYEVHSYRSAAVILAWGNQAAVNYLPTWKTYSYNSGVALE
jgi:hypothetical protein